MPFRKSLNKPPFARRESDGQDGLMSGLSGWASDSSDEQWPLDEFDDQSQEPGARWGRGDRPEVR